MFSERELMILQTLVDMAIAGIAPQVFGRTSKPTS